MKILHKPCSSFTEPTLCLVSVLLFMSHQDNVEASFPQVSTTLFEWSRRISDFVATRSNQFIKVFEPLNTVDFTQLIEAQGYPSESHRVTTEDVFHGHWHTSADWVINKPKEDSLGFHLSDRGYDVWLANERGNGYSMRHTSLTPADPKFWDFSIDEIGFYDVPAIIDYVLNQTGHKKVHYTAFSLGSASLLAALAKRPEYNEKIHNAVLLAPAVGTLKFLLGIAPLIDQIFNVRFGGFPLYPSLFSNLYHRILPITCHPM
ncbi:unnamed protein product [Orchesella dallaii]|uniref:AB hydrolase-1 domain-containing protein n=1 Tax=Orchesella dallaii TaxID=48710 RepID=A0ABP1QCU3_9HEXA